MTEKNNTARVRDQVRELIKSLPHKELVKVLKELELMCEDTAILETRATLKQNAPMTDLAITLLRILDAIDENEELVVEAAKLEDEVNACLSLLEHASYLAESRNILAALAISPSITSNIRHINEFAEHTNTQRVIDLAVTASAQWSAILSSWHEWWKRIKKFLKWLKKFGARALKLIKWFWKYGKGVASEYWDCRNSEKFWECVSKSLADKKINLSDALFDLLKIFIPIPEGIIDAVKECIEKALKEGNPTEEGFWNELWNCLKVKGLEISKEVQDSIEEIMDKIKEFFSS